MARLKMSCVVMGLSWAVVGVPVADTSSASVSPSVSSESTEQYTTREGVEVSRMQVETFRREKGIRAAAEKFGTYRSGTRLDKDVVAGDLATIADKSDLIARGTILSSASSVSSDGTWMITDYQFKLAEVFSGPGRPDEVVVLKVRLPGGRVEFPGGQSPKC
jgi:hypothetical protein